MSIVFEDNGVGMSPQVLARLGEPFFTTKDVGSGTGLGIAMVHGILADLNGAVHVRSEEGVGTEVIVELPVTEATVPTAAPAEAKVSSPDGRTVLIVDDEPLVRRMLERMVESIGLAVVVAGDGYRALELAAERRFDAVLLDLSMPGLSGVVVFERLRDTHPELPVIIVTGHLDEVAGLERAHRVLHKPVRRDDVARALHEVLDT